MGSGPVTERPQSSWELRHVRTQDESAAQRRPSPDLALPASRTVRNGHVLSQAQSVAFVT